MVGRISYASPSHGFHVVSGILDRMTLARVVETIREHAKSSPFEHPTMRDGKPMSVRVTSFGKFGWWADAKGYRYVDRHPTTGEAWPPIPHAIRGLTSTFLYAALPHESHDTWAAGVDTVLVNWYAPGASLGWHVDRTEVDKRSPIVTMSIGAAAIFEIRLSGEVHRITLKHGDGVVMAGASRNAEHRIVRLLPDEPKVNQHDLFSGPIPSVIDDDPLGNRSRMSITWRRTGLSTEVSPCA